MRDLPSGIVVHCFGCGKSGGALSLVAAAYRLDLATQFPEVLARAHALIGGGAGAAAQTRLVRRVHPVSSVTPEEIQDFWAETRRVSDDPLVWAWLLSRPLDPHRVEERNLMRTLPGSLPPLARGPGGDWATTGHRGLVPMRDHTGALISLQARQVGSREPKSLSPAVCRPGIFADAIGERILTTGEGPEWWQANRILIAEGIPDFLTWATMFGDHENVPAVFGIVSGSWTPEIAARIPSGCRVQIRRHPDDSGRQYAAKIKESLGARCVVSIFEGVR